MWEKVQMIRANKRRPTKKRNDKYLFGAALLCRLRAKLSLATANGCRHFRCSMYKRTSRAKECTQHYIREDALKQLVLKQLQQFLSYLQQFERVFIRQQIDTTLAERQIRIIRKAETD